MASAQTTFLTALRTAIDSLVPPEATVVLAVSGGPDSLALLLGCSELAGRPTDPAVRPRPDLHVAHFDHRLRPDSVEDVRFVEALAGELGLQFHTAAADRPLASEPGASLEEAARQARYTFLGEVARSVGAGQLATGHTADDQVETVLHAILRGTGIHGLAGMPRRRPLAQGVELVRPMLEISHRQVLQFLEAAGRPVRQDRTNADQSLTRNRIRHELLPLLRQRYNPRVDDAVLRLAGLARETSALLKQAAGELLDRALVRVLPGGLELAVEPLRSADRHLAAEALRLLLERQGWPRQEFGLVELQRLVELVHRPDLRAVDLPHAVRAEHRTGPPARLWLGRRKQR